MPTKRHWTNDSEEAFRFAVTFDFIGQIQRQLKRKKMSQKQLAETLGVSPGRVSQIFNDPDNLEISSLIRLARALSLKVSLVAYDDGDSSNAQGPILADIFLSCWEFMGKPKNLWEIKEDSWPQIGIKGGECRPMIQADSSQVEKNKTLRRVDLLVA
ncbi:MAG: helix-turn-helix transcriptional regulator [Candidatus Alcyoniella australis]|nr:helix-turn-helix transcriptional regulator [Candidatus Alcyoniella australis]